jgi:hypothetical protein
MSTTTVSSAMISSGVIPAVHRNDIINGGYLVNQENDTAAADDDYSIGDLFLHVGEAAVTTSLQTSGGPQGDRNFARINIDTANKQSGWVYFLSNADCQDYIANGKMSFGIKIKTTSAAIDTVRIGLLKWTGTADSVTSDVVATWAQDGTNPTLATSWSYENTPADVNLTTDWVRHTVENVTVDSDTNNLACFVWIDDGTIAEDDQFDVTEWQLNPGSTVNDFSSAKLTDVSTQVDYYLQRYNFNSAAYEYVTGGVLMSSTTTAYNALPWRTIMRVAPSVTSSAAGTFMIQNNRGDVVPSGVAFNGIGYSTGRMQWTYSGTFSAGDSGYLIRDSSDTTFIMLDARH